MALSKKPISQKLPELTFNGLVVPWAQNFVRTLEGWMALRPIVSIGEINFALDPAVLTTTLSNRHLTPNSFIGLTALNANAAGSLGTGYYVSSRDGGQALITHQGSSLTRSYAFIIVT
jgi:hypothetical protein